MNDPDAHLTFPLAGNRDREQRQAMCKVGGSVERVDDPAGRVARSTVVAALFGQDAVVGEAAGDGGADDLLGGAVVAGDKVSAGGLALGGVTAKGALGEDAASGLGNRESSVKTGQLEALAHGGVGPARRHAAEARPPLT